MYKKIILFLLLFFPYFSSALTSTVVMDVDSGRVLSASKEHKKMLIASTTKIMTCLIALENYNLDEEIEVGDEVLQSYGTNIYIEPGEVIRVKDLLYGLMLRSGNDASLSLAAHMDGGEDQFISLMNQKAKDIGMIDTTFQNPHGLDDNTENYSTSYDLALLSRYAYQNPIYREIISTKKYATKSSLKSYLWYNRVSLLTTYSNCIGGKNGYTPKAGKSLVSVSKKNDLTLTIVSLNDSDIYNHHRDLYEYYFEKYQNYKILDHKNFYISPTLISNKNVYIKDDFIYPLREDELTSVSTFIHMKSSNHSVGEVEIRLGKEIIGVVPIYEREKKEDRESIFQKLFSLFTR